MRRTPDDAAAAGAATAALTPPRGAGAGSGRDGGDATARHSQNRASSSTGVTLLLGCRVEDSNGGDRNAEQRVKKAEQVEIAIENGLAEGRAEAAQMRPGKALKRRSFITTPLFRTLH